MDYYYLYKICAIDITQMYGLLVQIMRHSSNRLLYCHGLNKSPQYKESAGYDLLWSTSHNKQERKRGWRQEAPGKWQNASYETVH